MTITEFKKLFDGEVKRVSYYLGDQSGTDLTLIPVQVLLSDAYNSFTRLDISLAPGRLIFRTQLGHMLVFDYVKKVCRMPDNSGFKIIVHSIIADQDQAYILRADWKESKE